MGQEDDANIDHQGEEGEGDFGNQEGSDIA